MAPSHHMFTAPDEEDKEKLDYHPEAVRSLQHDLVLNGFEVGGGSMRIHDSKMQKKIFDIIGLDKEEAEERFGFLLKAFEYGAPPHAGAAYGIDRLIAILAGLDSIRDTIAFPKTQKARCLMTGSPSSVTQEELTELGLAQTRTES